MKHIKFCLMIKNVRNMINSEVILIKQAAAIKASKADFRALKDLISLVFKMAAEQNLILEI